MPLKDLEDRKRYSLNYYYEHRDELLIAKRKEARQIKLEALIHYSSDPPTCLHCGEKDVIVLCIDHINNDGAEQRRHSIGQGRSGTSMYYWLKRNGYPAGFQVLCANCNLRKEYKRRVAERET